MAQNEPITTKFKVDISDLKKGISEANQSIKLANAQFKAASAGMEDWQKTTEGVEAKLSQLNSVLGAQKSKLANYQKQLQQLEQAQQENGKRAEELKAKYQEEVRQFGENSKKAQELKTALNGVEKEQLANEKAADRMRVTMLNQQATVSKTQREIGNYDNVLAKLKSGLGGVDKANKKAKKSTSDLGAGLTVVLGAFSKVLSEGISAVIDGLKEFALEGEDALDKFQASTGTSAQAMGQFRKEILDLYKGNYGDSIADVADAMAEVKQQTNETDPSKIKDLTQNAIALRDTFGFDIQESMRAVNMLTQQFGITGEQAFNLIAQGAQKGLNKNGDLLDSINEYGVHYKQMGVSAEGFFNSLENGTKAGTFSVDKLGDAYKEFGIRVKDTANTTTEAYQLLGLDADLMRKKFAKGGKSAADATKQVLKKLMSMDDKVKQNQAGVDLFSTMWEDLGIKGVKALTNVNGTANKSATTLKDLDKVRYDNAKSQLEMIGRSLKVDVLEPIVSAVVPALVKFGQWFQANTPAIVASLAAIGTGFAVFKIAMNIIELTTAFQNLMLCIKGLGVILATTPVGWLTMLIGATAGVAAFAIATNKATKAQDKNYVATEKLIESQKALNDTLKDSKKVREENTNSAKVEGKEADFLFKKLQELMEIEEKSTSQKEQIKNIVDQLNEVVPDLGLAYDAEKDKLNKSTEAIRENIKAQKDLLLAKAAQKNQAKIAEDIANIETQQGELIKQNTKNQDAYTKSQEKTEAAKEKWMKTGGQMYTKEWSNYQRLLTKEGEKKAAYDKTNEQVKKNQKELKKLNNEYDKTGDYAQQKINTAKIEQDLSAITEKCKKKGVEIPKAISDGIKAGQFQVPKSVKAMENLIKFNDSGLPAQAKLLGIKIPSNISSGIASGKMKPAEAKTQMERLIKFGKLAKEAGIEGKAIPDKLAVQIEKGEKKPQEALKKLQKKANKAGETEAKKNKSGDVFLNEAINQINKKSGEVKTSAKSAAKEGKNGFESVDTTSSGEYFTQGFINGMGSLLGGVARKAASIGKTALDALKEAQKEGSPSKLTRQSGEFFTQGFVNGINYLAKEAVKAAKNVAVESLESLNTELDEHSASKKTKKSGKYFTQGFVKGILSTKEQKALKKAPSTVANSVLSGLTKSMTGAEISLASLMKSVIGNVASTAKQVANGKFTDAGNAAAESFSNTIQEKLKFCQDKVSYQYEQELNKFDSKITKLEKDKKNDVNAAKKKRDKALKKLKNSKKYKNASKKSKKKMVESLNNKYAPGIKDIEKYYNDAIKAVKSKQDAYQKATEKSLSEFNDAMSKFGSEAEKMVSDTINGITETYQARWDNLTNLQNTMVSKLQGFGELFTVSGAGVMSVNDIKQQTEDIKAYMDRLNTIKGKVSEDLFNQIATYDVDQGKAFMDQLLSMSDAELKAYNDAYTEKMNVSEQMSKNLYQSDFDKVSKEYGAAINNAFKGLGSQLEALGKQCMSGFVDGLKSDTSYLSKAVQDVANSIISSFKSSLKIHSPSKVFAELGGFSAEGYGEGFKEQMDSLRRSLAASVPMDAIAKASGRISYGGNKTTNQNVNQVFNQYNTSPKALSRLEIYRQTKNALSFSKGV
jgi:phage-related minor tail protein